MNKFNSMLIKDDLFIDLKCYHRLYIVNTNHTTAIYRLNINELEDTNISSRFTNKKDMSNLINEKYNLSNFEGFEFKIYFN